MRPIDIYNSKVVAMGDFWEVEPHIYDEIFSTNPDYDKIEKSKKIIVKKHFHHNFDYQRDMTLASVWFENKPVMIIQHAGRGGKDHEARFITNEDLFNRMISFIRSFNQQEIFGLVGINEELETLTNFYGYNIEDDLR